MKNFASEIMEKVYKIIFGEEMTPKIRSFTGNLQIIAVGTGIGSLLGLVFQMLAGRILGPSEYGQYSLIQSIAMILYVPMLLGFNTAMVKYSAEKEDGEMQKKIISTAYIIVIALTIVSSAVYFLFQNQFARLLHISGEVLWLAVVFAICYALYTIATEAARGLFKMKLLAAFQAGCAIIILLAFLLLVYAKNILSYKSAVYSSYFAYGALGVILPLVFLRRYL
jgi:O-antigen/teichoic acid export membrane protein